MRGSSRSAARGTWAIGDPDARYDPHVALVVVDVQNDFADPSGSLWVRGGAEIVPLVNAEIERALAAGAAVAYTQDWHPAHTPHFAQDGGIWPVHCVRETWGAELHPALAVRGPVVRKGADGEDGYSGFSMRNPADGLTVPTELDATIAGAGAETAGRGRPRHGLLRQGHGPRRCAARLRNRGIARLRAGRRPRAGRRRPGPRRNRGSGRRTRRRARGNGLISGGSPPTGPAHHATTADERRSADRSPGPHGVAPRRRHL